MPRAGSGWYYNLTNDLVVAAGYQDGRQIRKKYHLERILTEVNCNIGALTTKRLIPVLIPSLMGNTFVIKAHAGPNDFAKRLIKSKHMLSTYIYRDPRDAMLSAYEYGQRALQKGRPNAFSDLTDFNKSLTFIQEYVQIWEKWVACEGVLLTRYEDLINNYEQEVEKLIVFLGFNAADSSLLTVLENNHPGRARSDQKGSHFSKGTSGRFREAYSNTEQEILKQNIGRYIEVMGYE